MSLPGQERYASREATLDSFRTELAARRNRLLRAVDSEGARDDIVDLLAQVDSALDRLGTPDYGRCLVCREKVDDRDLKLNPLLQYCLCDLTPNEQRELETDLETARRIQAALLPDPHVEAGGWVAGYRYEPRGVVSGDYCDLWTPDGDGSLFFAVGDVSGKGVAASLLMAHLQAAFRSLVSAGVPLAELVGRVNRQILDAGIPTHYATLACGRARTDGHVEIVNAGHCPPLLVRKGRVESVAATGFPIGLLEEKPYDLTTLDLVRGDQLILYTDGLTEARAPDGDEYGEERVQHVLTALPPGSAPRRTVGRLLEDVNAFAAGTGRLDDLTVLALARS